MRKGEFARKLSVLRLSQGWTQEDLAERLGVARETIVRWETGRHGAPQSKIASICKVFGVTEAEFWDPHYPEEYRDPEGAIEVVEPHPAPYIGIETDKATRATLCPRCGNADFTPNASFCGDCGCPLFNFCTIHSDHLNRPTVRHCETCGARTWWSLEEEQFSEFLTRLETGTARRTEEA